MDGLEQPQPLETPAQDLSALPQEPTPEPSPYDTSAETQELEALNQELAQSEATLEGDFAEYLSQNTSQSLEDLFFDDKKAFYLEIQKMQNAYYQEKIASKQERARSLQDTISQKQIMGGIDQARVEFEQRHSDADINELLAFYEDYMPNKVKAELDKLPPDEFFEAIYQSYQSMQGGGGETQDAPPRQIAGNASPSARTATLHLWQRTNKSPRCSSLYGKSS